MVLSLRADFLSLPSLTRRPFSVRISTSSSSAVPSSFIWGTSLPWIASCKILFLSFECIAILILASSLDSSSYWWTLGCIHDGWLVISLIGGAYCQDFLYYLLSSNFAYAQFSSKVAGAVVQNLNSDKVANSLFPIPPKTEQKRIVQKIESILPKVHQYEELSKHFLPICS